MNSDYLNYKNKYIILKQKDGDVFNKIKESQDHANK